MVTTLFSNQLKGLAGGEFVRLLGVARGVHRRAHQHHRRRPAGVARRRHQAGRGHHRDAGLADRHHGDPVAVLREMLDHLDQVVGVVVEVEITVAQRNVARVDPVGDVDVVLGQHVGDRAAQQRGVVARHRRDDQHLGVASRFGGGGVAAEMQKRRRTAATRPPPRSTGVSIPSTRVVLDAELRFAVAPRRVDEHLERRRYGATAVVRRAAC